MKLQQCKMIVLFIQSGLFKYVFYNLHYFFSFPIGLCIMWAAGFMRELVILGIFRKILTG